MVMFARRLLVFPFLHALLALCESNSGARNLRAQLEARNSTNDFSPCTFCTRLVELVREAPGGTPSTLAKGIAVAVLWMLVRVLLGKMKKKEETNELVPQ